MAADKRVAPKRLNMVVAIGTHICIGTLVVRIPKRLQYWIATNANS